MKKFNDFMFTVACKSEQIIKKITSKKAISFALAFLMVLSCSLTSIYAADADQEISSAINGGLKKVYNILLAIAVPIAVIAAIIAGIQMIYGGTNGTQKARDTLIRVGIALAIILLAPLLVSAIKSWFSNLGSAKESEVFGS